MRRWVWKFYSPRRGVASGYFCVACRIADGVNRLSGACLSVRLSVHLSIYLSGLSTMYNAKAFNRLASPVCKYYVFPCLCLCIARTYQAVVPDGGNNLFSIYITIFQWFYFIDFFQVFCQYILTSSGREAKLIDFKSSFISLISS